MTRLNLILVIAIILSAMFLVHSHYEARRSFMALEAATKEATRLELEYERLQVERRSQASPLRIEQIAKQELQMRLVTPGITQYVKQPSDSPASPSKVFNKTAEVKP
jgi:cell division protein FtsL